jgi:hypothetical protein
VCFQPYKWVIGIDVEQFTEDDLETDFKVFLSNEIGNETFTVKIYYGEKTLPLFYDGHFILTFCRICPLGFDCSDVPIGHCYCHHRTSLHLVQ